MEGRLVIGRKGCGRGIAHSKVCEWRSIWEIKATSLWLEHTKSKMLGGA